MNLLYIDGNHYMLLYKRVENLEIQENLEIECDEDKKNSQIKAFINNKKNFIKENIKK